MLPICSDWMFSFRPVEVKSSLQIFCSNDKNKMSILIGSYFDLLFQ